MLLRSLPPNITSSLLLPDKPDVFVFARNSRVQTKSVYMCETRGFNTSDIILNIKKIRCVQTERDGVKTEGVQQFRSNIYQRRDHVIILRSEVSNYSCEVIHAASRFRVVKVWDPVGGGRIISSKFIDTNKPDVFVFAGNATTETIVFSCLASGFYPNNIILNMKRNGRILTREDGVKSSGVCSNEDDVYKTRDYVEIKKSDKSVYSCEVIHAASDTHVEKVWDQPQVEMDSHIVSVRAEIGRHRMLTCRVRSINTKDIILNIKKNHCVLTKEDGVKTSGLKPHGDTYWRTDSVNISHPDKSQYSCEVIHASSSFHVEKVWGPDSDGRGRIISPEFIDTSFYPNNIILKMKRNGRILTREDGVKSSGVCSYEDHTFQRRDSVEIKTSDKSDYSCEVIRASGMKVEKTWDHQLPDDSGGTGHYTGIISGAVLFFFVLVLVGLFRRHILGAARRCLESFTSESKSSMTSSLASVSGTSAFNVSNSDTNAESESLNPSSSGPSISEQETEEEEFK
ncbi:uncharacterized protein LOC125019684 isoform X1 [Mugil cephalus]|uniref:uncharacterized protein LOC125019684 isoform X1 n=1 Tax=Mugil cephalus TaxID=48193 RepID=UPI001FB6CD75|nr:uncharacterized protein LOC125019684 isoform X1 [Mugil cephalus]